MGIDIYTHVHVRTQKQPLNIFCLGCKQSSVAPCRGMKPIRLCQLSLPSNTHFDVSHRMGLNAKCPGQQLGRGYLYNYQAAIAAIQDTLNIFCQVFFFRGSYSSPIWHPTLIECSLSTFLKKLYIFEFWRIEIIYADRYPCLSIMGRKDFSYSTVSPNMMPGIIKGPIF